MAEQFSEYDLDKAAQEAEAERRSSLAKMRKMRKAGKSEKEIWEACSVSGNISVYDLNLDGMTLEEKIELTSCNGIETSGLFSSEELQTLTACGKITRGKTQNPQKAEHYKAILEALERVADQCDDVLNIRAEDISHERDDVSIHMAIRNCGIIRSRAKSNLFAIIPMADQISVSIVDKDTINVTFTVCNIWKPELAV